MTQRVVNRKGKVVRPAIVLAAALVSGLAQAETLEWIGGWSELWRDGTNWSPVGEPFMDTSVLIASGEAMIHPSDNSEIGSLMLGPDGGLKLNAELKINGNFVSEGRLTMGGVRFASPRLNVLGDSLLSGAGTTVLSQAANVRRAIFTTQGLTVNAAHTLTGASGEIHASSITNRGVIESSGWLSVQAASEGSLLTLANTGVIRVVNGGRLQLYSSVNVDNRTGTIDIVDGLVSGGGATINGTVKGHGANSKLESMIQDATLLGTLRSTSLVVSGTVVNNAVLTLESESFNYPPHLTGIQDGFIGGEGRIEVASGAVAEVKDITLGSGQTFVGAALLSGAVVNQGVVHVRDKWTLDEYEGQRLVNQGTINVGQNAALELNDGVLDNAGGTLTFEGVSGIYAGYRGTGWVSGGTVKTTGQTWVSGDLAFKDVALSGELAVGASQLGLRGQIQVSSTLSVGKDAQQGGALRLHGDTVLTGGGTTVLARGSDGSSSVIESYPYSGGAQLTVDASHTVRGEGAINVAVLNKGLLLVDTGSGLRFGAAVTNTGTIRAQGGDVSFYTNVLNRGGLIDIANGGLLVGGGVIEGGVIVAQGDGARLQVSELRDLTLRGNWTAASTWQYSAASVGMSGTITHDGVLRVGGVSSNGELIGNLVVRGAGVLAGTGRTEIVGEGTQMPGLSGESWFPRASLTNAAGHTVAGRGGIANLNILNHGLFAAQGGTLTFIGAALRNEGQLRIDQGARLQMPEALVQDGPQSRTIVAGRLDAPRVDLLGGELSGSGVIHGALNVTGGTVRVGGDAGALSLEGDFTASDDSTLAVNLKDVVAGGEARLFVSGNAALAGLLILEFGADAKLGDTFEILYGSSLVSGAFSRVDVIGSELSASVNYFDDHVSVSLVSSVPEPSTSVLAMVGVGLLAVAIRRSRRRSDPA